MRSLGFQAVVERIEGWAVVIRTPTCPLRPIVPPTAEAAAIDRGRWSGLLARALRGGDSATVACETHGCLDPRASFEIRLRVEQSG